MIFFFQAEDGLRYIGVTGVQTCALPIWRSLALSHELFPVATHRPAVRDCLVPADRLSSSQSKARRLNKVRLRISQWSPAPSALVNCRSVLEAVSPSWTAVAVLDSGSSWAAQIRVGHWIRFRWPARVNSVATRR